MMPCVKLAQARFKRGCEFEGGHLKVKWELIAPIRAGPVRRRPIKITLENSPMAFNRELPERLRQQASRLASPSVAQCGGFARVEVRKWGLSIFVEK